MFCFSYSNSIWPASSKTAFLKKTPQQHWSGKPSIQGNKRNGETSMTFWHYMYLYQLTSTALMNIYPQRNIQEDGKANDIITYVRFKWDVQTCF